MNRCAVVCLSCLSLALGVTAVHAQSVDYDRVKVAGNKTLVAGKVTQTSPTEVTVDAGSVGSKSIPANDIEYIIFSDASLDLREARKAITEQSGNFEAAKTHLDKVNASAITRDVVRQDYEFYKALTAARLAQSGTSGALAPAVTDMMSFIKKNPTSYHYYEANQVLGDLAMALGQYDRAVPIFSEVLKAPWPDVKLGASVNLGRSLLALNRPAEAVRAFDAVLASKEPAKATEQQMLQATLGKGECLVKTDNVPDGMKMVEEVLAKASAEDAGTMSWGYNVLGAGYLKTNRKKDALLSYLKVDLIYSSAADAHAESLYNLAQLWEGEKPERATQAKQTLKQRYPNSPWAKKLGG